MRHWRQVDKPRTMRKWLKWNEEIEQEVARLYHHRRMFRRIVEVVEANPNINRPNALHDWMSQNYYVSAMVAVRRLVEKSSRYKPVSLGTLVTEIASYPVVITRAEFVRPFGAGLRYPKPRIEQAHRIFDRFAGKGRDNPDPTRLSSALAKATKRCEKVVGRVDKTLAHRDPKPPRSPLKLPELDAAIDCIGDLFREVHLLLTTNAIPDLEPVQKHWEWVLREPWILRPGASEEREP